jgi:hypothetical protein
MKHLPMDPAFPDVVGEWVRCEAFGECDPVNDNPDGDEDDFAEIFLLEIARLDIEATRAW